MKFWLEGWEDGQQVQSELAALDRWQTQAAERVTVELQPGLKIVLQQQPRSLTASRLGVGACIWDGALVLTAYLSSKPAGYFAGKRCVELGAGVGLVGVALAAMGADVTLTDRQSLVSLLRINISKNWLGGVPKPGSDPDASGGRADAQALQWGAPGYREQVAQLATRQPVDYVVATDCTYPDPEASGQSPDTQAFMAACAGLCSEHTACLVTFEHRGEDLEQAFLDSARQCFGCIEQLRDDQLPADFRVDHIQVWCLKDARK